MVCRSHKNTYSTNKTSKRKNKSPSLNLGEKEIETLEHIDKDGFQFPKEIKKKKYVKNLE